MSWHEHVNKGTLAMVRSDYDTAQRELTRALEVAKSECAQKHQDHSDERVRNTLGLIGQVHLKQSHYDEAQDFLSRSVEGEGHADATNELIHALYLISLSSIKRHAGDASGANYRFQQAVDALHPAFSRESNAAVQGLNQLFASVQRAQQQQFQQQFQNLLTKVHDQNEKRHGKGRAATEEEVARWQKLMADANDCLRQGSEPTDLVAYNRSLEATKLAYRMFDHDHETVAGCLSLLALCSQRLHLYDQGEALYKRAATIYGAKDGMQSEHAGTKLQLAAFYAEIFDFCQSLQNLTEVLETSDRSGRSELEHPAHILTMMARAELYSSCRETIRLAIEAEESERLEHAVILYGRAITLLQRILPGDHLEIAQALYFKSNVLRRLGQKAAADQAHEDAEAIEEKNNLVAKKWEKVAQSVPPFRIPPSRSV